MNVPKIRIKGFDGEWYTARLGQLGATYSGVGFPEKEQGGLKGVPFYKVSDMNNDGNETIMTNSNNYVTDEQISRNRWKPIEGPAIFFAKVGAAVLLNRKRLVLTPCLCDNNTMMYCLNLEKWNEYFCLKLFENINLASLAQTGSLPSYNGTMVENISVYLPQNITEQNQIAEYFGKLDSLIEATGKKITSLKQTKQACLQQMFPTYGETTPRIRFRGFEGVWQLRKIGELGTTYSGLSGKSKADFSLGSAQYITFLNVLTNAHIDTTIFESVNIKPGEKQNKVVKGDILFNTSSETPEEVGYCSVLMNDVENLYLNSFCFGFRPYSGTIDPEFMVYLMRGQVGRSIMKILAQGATRYNLSKNRLCEVTIPIPANNEEQQQIAAFFSNMDKQIRIQEQKLEKLKQIKTACIENMFV